MLQQCSLKGRSVACFHVGPVARSRAQSIRRSGRLLCATVRAENVLIMNTKGVDSEATQPYPICLAFLSVPSQTTPERRLTCIGGGHAFIGLYLAKQLLKDGHSVTILNDGDEVWAHPFPSCTTEHVQHASGET